MCCALVMLMCYALVSSKEKSQVACAVVQYIKGQADIACCSVEMVMELRTCALAASG